jgi:hypothetical protein
VVGSFGPGSERNGAFAWHKVHGMEPKLVIPTNSGWTLEVASSINDRGEIVGRGDYRGMENAVFLRRVSRGTNPSRRRRVRAGPPISLLRTFFPALGLTKRTAAFQWNAALTRYWVVTEFSRAFLTSLRGRL